MEDDEVTKEKRKVDQEQDKRSETVAMMMILIVDGVVMDIIEMIVDKDQLFNVGMGDLISLQGIYVAQGDAAIGT